MKTELDKFYGLIDEIKVAMLTTRRPDGHLESRAMANQKRAGGADLWFVTAEGTSKLRDIEHDPHVNLAYYQPGSDEWVSASGIASLSRDRAKIRELYEPDWKGWFGEEGDPRHGTADDPRIVLIGIDVHAAVFLEVEQAEADRPIRAGEGLADRPASGAWRDTRAGTAASIVTCAETAMPLQRYAIDLQPASRNPATNAAWSRRALGPRPQDLAYTSFLTRGEDTETSYRPPAQRTWNARMSRPRRRTQLSNGRGVSNRLVFI